MFPSLRKANDIVACIYPVRVELHLFALYPHPLNNQFHFDLAQHCAAMPWYYRIVLNIQTRFSVYHLHLPHAINSIDEGAEK